MQPATLGGGGGGGLTIGTTTITGGATTQVLFNLAGVVSSSALFTYSDTLVNSGPGIKIGSTGTSAGLFAGYLGASGFGAIWPSTVTPSSSNYAFAASSSETDINGTAIVMAIGGVSTLGLGTGAVSLQANVGLAMVAKVMIRTAPTLASGGCTTPTAVTSNGTAAFSVGVGTSCSGSQPLVFTLPAATTGWMCVAKNTTNGAASAPAQTGAVSTTAVTITSFSRTLGTAAAWTDADVVVVSCMGY